MLFVVWIRSKFLPYTVGGDALTYLKHAIYPMEMTNDGNHVSPVGSAQEMTDFMLFNKNPDLFEYGYNPTYDYTSPLFFYPTNCNQQHSFMFPQVESNIIAIVNDYPTDVADDRGNEVVTNATLMEDMKDYL